MRLLFFRKRRISRAVLLLFTRQLAILLHAELPLIRSLEILAEQESNRSFKQTLLELIENIQRGNTFSESLAAYPDFFPSFYLNMVRAGEISGMLGLALDRLLISQEKMQKIYHKMTSILLYPALVLIMTLLMMAFLAVIIIPKFEAVFAEALVGGALPPLTQRVLEVSRYGRDHLLNFFLGLGLLCIVTKIAFTVEHLCKLWDRLLLKLPLLGSMLQKYFVSNSFYTLGTLTLHRVPMLEAIQVTQKISDNRTIQAAIKMIYQSIQAGDSLVTPLQANPLFPPMVISMVAVGEETGQLPEMLLQVATIYEQEVDHRATQLMTLMEPCLILLLACFVGTVVIALFLPLITMIGNMGG
ncbi:MAG: type II secretion system F family protein [Chthoniobacterales bacterium]